MLTNYLPILIFMVVGMIIGVAPIVVGYILGPTRPDDEKLSQYECGFPPFEDARLSFDVRFYLVSILFIIFDLEIAFLFPWAISLGGIGPTGFCQIFEFFWNLFLFIRIQIHFYSHSKAPFFHS